MSRNPAQVRDATPDDATALLEIWGDPSRRAAGDRSLAESPEQEAANGIARIAADPDQRLVVGVIDDTVVGAMHVTRALMSPICAEQCIQITHLQVRDAYRRHGIGHALVEAAVSWAEEKDTANVLVAASVSSRDANRFMARLGFAQIAMIRGASVSALRAKLPVEPPAAARVGNRCHRSVGQVLAQRRSQRRAQAKIQD